MANIIMHACALNNDELGHMCCYHEQRMVADQIPLVYYNLSQFIISTHVHALDYDEQL